MEKTNQRNAQRDRSSSAATPPIPPSPDPLENPASRSPRHSRFEQLMAAYKALSCTNEDTDAPADAISLSDLNASQPSPAGPRMNETSTSTHAKDGSETTKNDTPMRARIGRLFTHATHPCPRLRLPNISISRLSFLHRGRGSSSSKPMANGKYSRAYYSSNGVTVFEYDPYTVRGTTPPLAGPHDFSFTSQQSSMWRPGQQQRRLRAGSGGSQWGTQRPPNPGLGKARDGGGLSSYGYERAYGRGYAYGRGNGSDGGERAAAAQRERERNANSNSTSHGGSRSGSVQIQALPRLHGPWPRRRRAESTTTTTMINEESEHPHASSSHVPNCSRSRSRSRSHSRSVMASPSSSVYSHWSGGSIDDTCSSIGCCSRRNADEEADKADRANNDDVLLGPDHLHDPTSWPTRPSASRSDSHASSLALLRWESSYPGSPYPSPFRPGLASWTTGVLKRQRERRAARQRQQQQAAEEETRRSVSASASAALLGAGEDDDGEYAAALASLDNRSASASAVLMNGDDDDDGVYAAALASMPLPMPVPPETDAVVVGAIAALRECADDAAMQRAAQRGRGRPKPKQDALNMKARARGGADGGALKNVFRKTW